MPRTLAPYNSRQPLSPRYRAEVVEAAIASLGYLIGILGDIEDATGIMPNRLFGRQADCLDARHFPRGSDRLWHRCFASDFLDFVRSRYVIEGACAELLGECEGQPRIHGAEECAPVTVCDVRAPTVLSAVLRLGRRLEEAVWRALAECPDLARALIGADDEMVRQSLERWGRETIVGRLRPVLANIYGADLERGIIDLRKEFADVSDAGEFRAWREAHTEAVRWLALARFFREVWDRYVTSAGAELLRMILPELLPAVKSQLQPLRREARTSWGLR